MRVISMCDDRGEAQSDAGEEYVPPAHKERTDPYPYLPKHRTATRSGWALQACVRILDSRQSVEGRSCAVDKPRCTLGWAMS